MGRSAHCHCGKLQGDPGTGNVFPQEEYEAKMTAVYDGFAAIARRLTKIVVEIYGLPPTWVEDEFQAPTLTSFKVQYELT
jgi:hypothetical protein